MSAEFNSNRGEYTPLQPFKYWCEKVLPLTYDDSVSYYELLCKVVEYLNYSMDDVTTLNGDMTSLYESYAQLQNYVNTYFDNLDVQQEINNKLDAMVLNGTLTRLVRPFVGEAVSDWLEDNVEPTGSVVLLDRTMTVRGAAADAEAVGFRLSEKEDILAFDDAPTAGSMAPVHSYGIKNYVDGAVDDIEDEITDLRGDVEDEIADLKGDYSKLFDEIVYATDAPIPVEWEYGNIDASGNNANNDRVYYARFKSAFVPKENMTLNVKKVLATGITNYVVVEYDATTHSMTDRTVYSTGTAPNIDINATVGKEYRLVIMCSNTITINLSQMDSYVTVTTITEINKTKNVLSEAVVDIAEIKNTISPGKIVEQLSYTSSAGYTSKSGIVVPGGTTYAYTNKIAVKPGDVIRGIAKNNGSDSVMRFIAAFKGDRAVSASGAENVYNYTVPNGIDGLVITGYQGIEGDVTSIPNFYKFTDGFVDKKTDSNGFVVKNSSVTAGDTILIPLNNVSKNVVLSLDATVDTFSSLEFGRTKITEKIAVTSENVIFYSSTGSVLSTTPHGLTIENTISVRIVHDADANVDKVSVIVASNGIIADPITKGWSSYRSGNVYVKSDGTTLTDCTVSFAMSDINKALWLFGDSYCSITYNRWVGQLNIAGYLGNILLNAYPGESAAQETPSFINLVNKGNPKAIVWACGMNDNGDISDNPSNMWLNAVNVFVTACESRGIIPILATIPTVPTINNEQKNAWVRNSGKRYIDFAKAVGANSSGVWYTGMLSNDGVHPTEKGAIALFNRAVADCPELMEQ